MKSGPATLLRLLVWSLFLFSAVIILHTRHNDFAWYYHPDEPGKVEQVLGMRPWNFHHPMLLLSTTKLAVGMAGAKSEQAVVEVGRTVSAIFTAGAVVALSLLAWRWRGWIAALATGLALLCHHQLFELSHYMKEDTALLLGIAVTLAAAYEYALRRTLGAAIAVGLGCGLAISGKYLGVVVLFVAIPILWRYRRPGTFTAAGSALLVVLVLTNLPLLGNWATFSKSFSHETSEVISGNADTTRSVPHSAYWSYFLANSTPVTWILLAALLWSCFRRHHELTFAQWAILIFPFAYTLLLSFSPKDNDRYFLPAAALFTFLAALGTHELAWLLGKRVRPLLAQSLAGLALVAAQFPDWTDDRGGLLRYDAAFQIDDTAELVGWLRANVAPAASIATDKKVRLPTPLQRGTASGLTPLPNNILSKDYLADLGTLDEMRANGVTHLVITASTYGKFQRLDLRPQGKAADKFEARKYFYGQLRRDHDPIKTWPRGTVLYLHPGLEVYHIAHED
jgi:hypothetical protein